MKLQVIGTGSTQGNAYLLWHNKECLLLDAGLPMDAIYRAVGEDFTALQGALISHSHMDHGYSVKKLLKQFVNILCTEDCAEQLGIQSNNVCVTLVRHGCIYSVGNWLIQPFSMEHDVDGSVGFLIQYAGEDDYICYMTDTAYTKYKLPPLTSLIVECSFTDEKLKENYEDLEDRFVRLKTSHMSLKRLLKMLEAMDRRRLRNVVLVHLSDLNSDQALMKSEVEKATGAKVWIADKGVEIEL